MSMQFDRFTVKSREAVNAARLLAERSHHQELFPEHVLFALLDDKEGIVASVLERLGANTTALRAGATTTLGTVPVVTGGGAGEVRLSRRLSRVFDEAFEAAKRLGDDYVSVEHLLLALLADKEAKELLRRQLTPASTGKRKERISEGGRRWIKRKS